LAFYSFGDVKDGRIAIWNRLMISILLQSVDWIRMESGWKRTSTCKIYWLMNIKEDDGQKKMVGNEVAKI
jgi:hypothetical protein